MIVRVLGSAAGGGVPQWNCACANCSAARAGTQPRRSQSSFAFSATGERWWLVNISPDIAAQIEANPPLQPKSGRGTPIAGVLLTDANVDHLGGLAVVRQDGEHAFEIRSSATVRALATAQLAFASFAAPPHRWTVVTAGERFDLGDDLEGRVIPISGATPGYDGRVRTHDAVIAYEIVDTTARKRVLFAPIFPDAEASLVEAASRADVGFFDGSFWSDEELGEIGGVEKPARALGHAPVGGPDGSLAVLSALPAGGRRFFAHLNNTNPMLDRGSLAYAEIARCGFELAEDTMEIIL